MFGNEQLTTELHLRFISLDRPGMGLSDFQPARRFGDWPADVIALADRLDIGRFAVLGLFGWRPLRCCVCPHRT
jgi:pimeloyl-ACP methyl ester carboxylesterase